jgi:hypothetical protein
MNDVFDEIFALLTPDRLLRDPRATGEGVTVCVIDSGVDRTLLEQKHRGQGHDILPIAGGIFRPEQPEPLPYLGQQSTPHGTTVADIILTLAPRVQLYSADIFGSRGTCEVDVVMRALHWAINVWKCKIVNLSLGVAESRLQQLPRRYQLLRAIEEAYFKDVLVFAAAHNDHPLTRSYPAIPDLGRQAAVRRSPPVRLSAPRANRVPGPRPRLPGTLRRGTGNQLGSAAPGRHCGTHPVATAVVEAFRDQDDFILDVSGRAGRREALRRNGYTPSQFTGRSIMCRLCHALDCMPRPPAFGK